MGIRYILFEPYLNPTRVVYTVLIPELNPIYILNGYPTYTSRTLLELYSGIVCIVPLPELNPFNRYLITN